MSNIGEDVKLSLKVMINKEKTKVVFAEADSDFANVLLSFLTQPLGRIVKLLEKRYGDKSPVFGSITSLYKGLANLDDIHFSTNTAKPMLLDPKGCSDFICRNLKFDISNTRATNVPGNRGQSGVQRLSQNVFMNYDATPLNPQMSATASKDAARLFTINNASFIISEDLRLLPYSNGIFQTLTNLGVTGAEVAELRNVTLGTDEIMDLLKCCLLSETPLTDFILNKGEIVSWAAKPAPGFFFNQIAKENTSKSDKIILKAMVQKSSNKLLFAQAGEDFVELLFTFLMIPIGGVESLLDTNTRLKNLDNLHRSVTDVGLDKYFITQDTKKRLMNPCIPPFSKPKNTILPLVEESAVNCSNSNYINYHRNLAAASNEAMATHIKSLRGDGNYVVGPAAFMVTDDLTVTPFCMSAFFSLLSRLYIPLSDVDEVEVRIGLQEVLSILKASLTSASALTNGLVNHIIRKQPKQEQNCTKPHFFHPYKK